MKNKTESNHKESTPGEIKKHEEKIAGFIGSLNDYGDPFHESAQNMAEMLGNIKNGLLSARKYGTERVEQFIKKNCSREVIFYDPIQRSTIAMSLKKEKQRKVISVHKEDCQVLELFAEKYPEKHETFKYPLIISPLAISTPERKSY